MVKHCVFRQKTWQNRPSLQREKDEKSLQTFNANWKSGLHFPFSAVGRGLLIIHSDNDAVFLTGWEKMRQNIFRQRNKPCFRGQKVPENGQKWPCHRKIGDFYDSVGHIVQENIVANAVLLPGDECAQENLFSLLANCIKTPSNFPHLRRPQKLIKSAKIAPFRG